MENKNESKTKFTKKGKEEKITLNDLENTTTLSEKDYLNYHRFIMSISAKKGLSVVMQYLILLAACLLFFMISLEMVKGFEAGNALVISGAIVGLILVTFATLINIYSLIKLNILTLFAKNLSLFIITVILAFLLYNQAKGDLFMQVLIYVIPVAALAGIFLPNIVAKKEYQRYQSLTYKFKFSTTDIEIEVSLGEDKKHQTTIKYSELSLIYELETVFYLFISPKQAISIKKDSFKNGDCDTFLQLLARNQKSARLIKWN